MRALFALVAGSLFLSPALAGTTDRVQIGYSNTAPVWSPSGKQIAFASDHGAGALEIWVMSATGKNRHNLGPGHGQASWSRDGKRLALWSEQGIAVVRRDGTGRRQIADWGWAPDWSARNEIAYVGDGGVHVVRPDGTNDHVLTGGDAPHWSPNGRHLAFLLDGDVWRIDPDGSNLQQLTRLAPLEARALVWAPNGTAIAFTVAQKQSHPPKFPFELWRVGANGSHAARLVHYNGGSLGFPTWSPNSRVIAFVRGGVFEIRQAGGHPKRIAGYGAELTWGRTGRFAYSNTYNIFTMDSKGRHRRNLTKAPPPP
jgi:Tol biopolymer transport system component